MIIPRQHQAEAIQDVAAGLHDADRGQLIMACGTGKTYTSLWVKERLAARLTLVLVPSLGLIPKFRSDWVAAASTPFAQLCVCSDDSVGRAPAGAEPDDLTFTKDELAHLGCPVTSSPDVIRRFLEGVGERVIFATYHSSPLIAAAQSRASTPAFDLAIADEAHRCAGRVDSAFATILDDTRIRARKRLFATATPKIYTAKNGEEEVVSMDDAAVFGEVLHRLSFSEAIGRGLLTDYRVVIIGVDDPMVQSWIDAGRTVETVAGGNRTAEDIAAQIGVLKAIQDYDLKRVLSFHSRVDRATEFAEDLVREWTTHGRTGGLALRAECISGDMPAYAREDSLGRLRNLAPGERRVISNVRCLSEGVDVPALDGVVFADPRSSATEIVQTVGRAIRKSADKELGTIVLPVFLGGGDTVDDAINASRFKPVVDVIRALKSHDDDLAAQLSQMRGALGHGERPRDGEVPKVIIDLPERLSAEIRAKFDEGISTYLLEQTTSESEGRFEAYFDALLRDGARFDYKVPFDFETPDGLRLGRWCVRQRKDFNAGRMPPERQARFEALPGWAWDLLDAQFERMFDALLRDGPRFDYKVPFDFETTDGLHLGQWCSEQRKACKAGRMPPERQARFEALPGWTWDAFDARFERMFDALLRDGPRFNYKVPFDFETTDVLRLARWCVRQRKDFNAGRMPPERQARFEALPGWTWDARDAQFERMFDALLRDGPQFDYKVPIDFETPDGLRLGRWCGTQRAVFNAGRMPPERQARFEALPGWTWDARSQKTPRPPRMKG